MSGGNSIAGSSLDLRRKHLHNMPIQENMRHVATSNETTLHNSSAYVRVVGVQYCISTVDSF
jgi:hypothetical protein